MLSNQINQQIKPNKLTQSTPYFNDRREQGRPRGAVSYERYKTLEKEFVVKSVIYAKKTRN